MLKDEDFEPPEVPFVPKPTSVSVAALPSEFSSESNFTTMPKMPPHVDDIHGAQTMILDGRGRNAAAQPPPRARSKPKTMPPPPPPPKRPPSRVYVEPEDVHSQPTMIIDINQMRRRGRG